MIPAYHIIALNAQEQGRFHYGEAPLRDASIASVRARWQSLLSGGAQAVLKPRRDLQIALGGPDRSSWEDDISGDDAFIFLSIGPRYSREDHDSEIAFGFIFDAEDLIRRGALLGLHDLAADYTDIIGEVVEIVAATLPRLPMIPDNELDEFMALMGEEDDHMREILKEKSTDPANDLLEAIRARDESAAGYEVAIRMIAERISVLHAETRLSGDAALIALLRQELGDGQKELLCSDWLPIRWRIGEVIGGKDQMRAYSLSEASYLIRRDGAWIASHARNRVLGRKIGRRAGGKGEWRFSYDEINQIKSLRGQPPERQQNDNP